MREADEQPPPPPCSPASRLERFRALRVTNVSWVWTLTAYAFRSGDPTAYFPGADVVDWIGADGYANVDCPWLSVSWVTWEEIFGAAAEFAVNHDRPLVIAEFSAREDPDDPARKAKWLLETVDAVRAMPAIKVVVSFNSVHSCSSPMNSSEAALDAYRSVGAHPLFAPTAATERSDSDRSE